MLSKIITVSVFLALAFAEKETSSRIVGGNVARIGEFPWLVWLGRGNLLRCHGSLIRDDLVLTSKSCLKELKALGNIIAVIGDGNRKRENVNSPSQRIGVKSWNTQFGNLVVLKLEKAANISKNAVKNVDVIRPATKAEENEIVNKKLRCFLTGWGWKANNFGRNLIPSWRIQKLQIKFTDRPKCLGIKDYDRKTELCYKVSETEGPCDLDDGAPIACMLRSEWLLVGVDTGKRKKNRDSSDYNVRCRGGLVSPISVAAFYDDIQKRIDGVYGDASSPNYPVDCTDARRKGMCSGGAACDLSVPMSYGYKDIKAVCDQTTDGGGWTIIQRRFDGSVDFYRNFRKYEFGFGSKSGEYWLGLKWIRALTENGNTEMRIDLMNHLNITAYQVFQDFRLGQGRGYKLNVGSSSGTAGDRGGFSTDNGSLFSTYDNDQGGTDENLAIMYHTGWWLPSKSGSFVNLNGDYGIPGTINFEYSPPGGFTHIPFNDLFMLESASIMVRRK